ncbi:MAG: ChaN family lipoprotein, partial [Gemmatimonadota bacterium]
MFDVRRCAGLRRRGPLLLLLSLLPTTPALAQDSTPGIPAAEDTAYTAGEYRVFTGAGDPASLDDIVEAMANVSVVFVGETHDDPTQHMLEAELLKRAYAEYGGEIALSLEFFQRDVQPIVDEYLAGLISEKSFLADARPWPRYDTDYRRVGMLKNGWFRRGVYHRIGWL